MHLLSPQGFRASGVRANIKASGKPDLALLIADSLATAAAVFTTNRVLAAPVLIGQQHIRPGKLRGIVVNAGNANACTGKQGEKDALQMCSLTAKAIGADPNQILPSSTGIIGHPLPMDKIQLGITLAAQQLGNSEAHAQAFMAAILTTDLKPKHAAAQLKLGKQTITLAGVCKGSGMIGPRLAPPQATMLAYLTTDASIPAPLLKKLLTTAADTSFNAVTVDDHASTNDTLAILASGASNTKLTSPNEIKKFTAALNQVCQSLAYQIAADGEGATKVVKIIVKNAPTKSAAQAIARAIANSPLVKCAMNGNDPNWGRIISAAGYADAPFNPNTATLKLQGIPVFRNGTPLKFDATKTSQLMNTPEVVAELNCGSGKATAMIWTCDLSKDYVTINADYHT